MGEMAEMVAAAIECAREEGVPELVANVSGLTGFPSPSLSERFHLVTKWAAAAAGSVRLAVVARAEMVDPHKFGVTVAANRHLTAEIFATESEAEGWLDRAAHGPKPPLDTRG